MVSLSRIRLGFYREPRCRRARWARLSSEYNLDDWASAPFNAPMTVDPPTSHQSGLFKHSLLLLMGTQIGNVATMLYQIVMMHQLDRVEYGVLASLLSLILIIGTPLEALRTAVAHQVALLTRTGQSGAIGAVLWHWARALMIAALIFFLLGLVFQAPMTRLLQLPVSTLMVWTATIMAGSLFIPFFAGALQGLQAFLWMAIHGQVWAVTRFGVALLCLAWIGRSAFSGLVAQAIAVVASVAVGLWAIRRAYRRPTVTVIAPVGGWSYFLWSLCALAGYAVLMNADVALVKIFFSPEDAGEFAQAATIARSIVFLPVPIAAAMFPKVVSAGLSTASDRVILVKSVVFTGSLILFAGVACTLAASPIWRFFTGESPTPDALRLVRWMIWALSPLGLTFLLMNFELAQRRFRAPLSLLLLAAAYIVGVSIWHDTYWQVLTLITGLTITSLLLMSVDVLRGGSKRSAAPQSIRTS